MISGGRVSFGAVEAAGDGGTHHPFLERKRPMAGSGSLYGERVERGRVCQGRGQRTIAVGGLRGGC